MKTELSTVCKETGGSQPDRAMVIEDEVETLTSALLGSAFFNTAVSSGVSSSPYIKTDIPAVLQVSKLRHREIKLLA